MIPNAAKGTPKRFESDSKFPLPSFPACRFFLFCFFPSFHLAIYPSFPLSFLPLFYSFDPSILLARFPSFLLSLFPSFFPSSPIAVCLRSFLPCFRIHSFILSFLPYFAPSQSLCMIPASFSNFPVPFHSSVSIPYPFQGPKYVSRASQTKSDQVNMFHDASMEQKCESTKPRNCEASKCLGRIHEAVTNGGRTLPD